MSRKPTLLLLLVLAAAPRVGRAEVLELTPDAPPRVIPLPPGVDTGDVRIEVVGLEVEDGRRPRPRTLEVAGRPLRVAPRVASRPFRVRGAVLRGARVLLISAERYVPTGRVARVLLRLSHDATRGRWPVPVPVGWVAALPDPDPVLAIVSNRIVVSRSRVLPRYVAWRRSQGLRVIVGTEDDWDEPCGEPPDGRAERIRAWLRNVRDEVGLGYVLLVGDPNPQTGAGVPMKLTHPMTALVRIYPADLEEQIDPVPTDHYFADLDGNWDMDGDGRFGEFPEDRGPNGIRWEPDALVGRLPVYWNDVARLDEMLEAILDYEASSSAGYRHRLLLPAAYIGFEGSTTPTGGTYQDTIDGAEAAEYIARAVGDLDPASEIVRLYEDDGLVTSALPHERALDAGTLIDLWREGAGLVVAIGHGSPEGIYRSIWRQDLDEDGVPDDEDMDHEPFLGTWGIDELDSAPPAFAFLATCNAGWPEFWDNLGAGLLSRGAIAVVASSRISVGGGDGFEPDPGLGDVDTLAYAFSHLVLEGVSAGAAAAYLRYGLPADEWGSQGGYPLGGHGWLGKLELNLYGDPLLRMGWCDGDDDCAAPSDCHVPGRCEAGFCVPQGEPVDCSALDAQCTVGRCEPDGGACVAEARSDGASCDDGLVCTVVDRCVEGACTAGEPLACDPRPGYDAACVEEEGGCVYERRSDDDDDDGDGPAERFGSCGSCAIGSPRPHQVLWRLVGDLLDGGIGP